MTKKKVCVIGHFAFGKKLLNGQTIKTRIITNELEKQMGEEQVLKIDTCGGWKSLLKAPFQVLYALKNSENILVFPAHNGVRVYVPLLVVQSRMFKNRKLHYMVIGGWLPEFLGKRKWLSSFLQYFVGIYVETKTMKKDLEKQGFENIYVVPNCKKINVLAENELIYTENSPYKVCTFSRVMREKGIEEAIYAIETINTECGYRVFELDIYGQVDEEQKEWFENLTKAFPEYICYCGTIPYDETTEVLKKYYALLFPTYYEGEGFAGTLIDAYSAGVPVIASDWKYNKELVNTNVGYVYPTRNQTAFIDILKLISSNSFEINDKKKFCLKEAEKYKIDKSIKVLIDKINGN